MEIAAGPWIMVCPKKPDMLMVSTRGCCCTRNVKNPGSRKFRSTALPRTTPSGLPFRNRHSARPVLHSPSRLHAVEPVSYTHLRAHETRHEIVCRLLLEKKKKTLGFLRCKHGQKCSLAMRYRMQQLK